MNNATTHLSVIYFKKSDALNTEHENLVLMSDIWYNLPVASNE
jgi:hypothetical protein